MQEGNSTDSLLKPKEVSRERLPWSQITDAERIERLREIAKREQREKAQLRQEIYALRNIVLYHRHGQDNELLIPAQQKHDGQGITCDLTNARPGQEWF